MARLLLLDKDGTLVRPKSGGEFVQSPEDQELLPGVEGAIADYVADGYTLVIVSNQGGVAAGHKTLESAIAEMRYCMELLPEISGALFCPDFEGEECWLLLDNEGRECITSNRQNFRKPHPGMLNLAIRNWFGISADKSEALMVGDRPEDEQAAIAAGVRFVWADEWRKE